MSGRSIRSKGVFLSDEPTIEKLKGCALFWRNIVVFEAYLSEVVEYPELVGISYTLFEKGVLKICHTPDGLKSALRDKIYAGLDSDLWEYLYRNSEKVTVEPELSEDAEKIIRESTDRDNKDSNLQSLIDSIVRYNIDNKWLEPIREYDRVPFDELPKDIQRRVLSKIKEIADIEYEYYEKRDTRTRYGFEWRNKYLLEQTSVSSALFTPSSWLPYYQYKLGDYTVRAARRYLQGLEAVMPFVKRDSIESFSLEEILEIRRNRRWNNAMDRLGDLCNEVKYRVDTGRFMDEMRKKVISEYQDVLGEEEMTIKDLEKHLLKGSIFTGISLIPIVGNVVSAVTGVVDPIVAYLWKEKSQRNLPFFLNDLRKMGN